MGDEFDNEATGEVSITPIEPTEATNPLDDVIERIQFGGHDEARDALRTAIDLGIAERDQRLAFEAEGKKTGDVVKAFLDGSPHVRDDKMMRFAGLVSVQQQQ